MALALVRIDDRLIHGQVVEGWIPYLKADRVAVVSNAAAEDETQQALMHLALPEDVALSVLDCARAPALVAAAQTGPGRTLVLAPGPREVLALLEGGVSLGSVNVGGMHYSAGRIRLGRVIMLDEEDRRALIAIAERGVRLEGRAVPSDAKTDVAALLRPERQ